MAEGQDANAGLILRGSDGSLYFIRDEILAACKAEGVYESRLQEAAGGASEVEGFAMSLATSDFQSLGSVRVSYPSAPFDPATIDFGRRASTVMCPW
jgi:hypothetical protein